MAADDWDQLEALSGRFGRLTDLVLHKVFRTIDRYELEETGSLLDSSNRAVKRGLIDSVDALRDLKDFYSMKPEHILPDFKRGLDRFNEAMALEPVDDVHRTGCIQYFEFTFDLAWKSIQSVATYYGLEPVKSPRVGRRPLTLRSNGLVGPQHLT